MKDRADAILQAVQAHYLDALGPPRDALLLEMEREAARRGEPISDPEVAAFLDLIARLKRPRVLIEVGTNIGYGAIVLARAAGEGARVHTVEKNEALCNEAQSWVARANVADRVRVICDDARSFLSTFEGSVDLVYIDCVKEHYVDYLDALLPKMSEGAVLLADNVLWKGHVASEAVPESERTRVSVLRAFNQRICTSKEFRGLILPLGDGVAFGIRTS